MITCNWDLSEADEPPRLCGNEAVAVYSRLNPRRRQPDQPRILTWPACKSHDTPRRQAAATKQGYDREEL